MADYDVGVPLSFPSKVFGVDPIYDSQRDTGAVISFPAKVFGVDPLEGTFNDIEVTWVAGTVEGEGVGGGTLVRNVPFLVRTDG